MNDWNVSLETLQGSLMNVVSLAKRLISRSRCIHSRKLSTVNIFSFVWHYGVRGTPRRKKAQMSRSFSKRTRPPTTMLAEKSEIRDSIITPSLQPSFYFLGEIPTEFGSTSSILFFYTPANRRLARPDFVLWDLITRSTVLAGALLGRMRKKQWVNSTTKLRDFFFCQAALRNHEILLRQRRMDSTSFK